MRQIIGISQQMLILLILVWSGREIQTKAVHTNKQVMDWETELHKALSMRQRHEEDSREEYNLQKAGSKNYGLINTIVNHNNQLKKINLIVNNYPNASHVKEVIEKNERD